MLEKIIDFIGRALSVIFRKSNDIIDNTKTEYGMVKQQVKVAKVNTQSTLNISISGENHVNYFRNRVIGEFLKVMSSLVSYKYDESSGKYVAYFVRYKRKFVMEYIKFSKDKIDDIESFVSYTYINKIISSTGVTTNIGKTNQKVLLVTDSISTCVYDSISGKKAPLYLVYVLGDKIGIGNPTFVYDSWVLITKLIDKKVQSYISDKDTRDGKLIETLMSQAGIHMYMSYFRSLTNPFYRTSYLKTSITSISSAVKDYNSRHFNSNKILNFSFDYENKGDIKIEISPNKDFSIVSLYGITIKFTGVISESGQYAAERFNYKIAQSIIKTEDASLKYNFLFYMFSTGGIDDEDIVKLNEEKEIKEDNTVDSSIAVLNQRVEPVITDVMNSSNFNEGSDGDLVSRDFEEFIEQNISSKVNNSEIVVPKVDDSTMYYSDTLSKEERILSNIESLRKESETLKEVIVTSKESIKVNNNTDIIRNLREQAVGDVLSERQVDTSKRLQSKFVDSSNSVKDLLNTPLIQWSSEDCMKVLGSDEPLNANITRQDVLERMMFLSTQRQI